MDIIYPETVILNCNPGSRDAAIELMADAMEAAGALSDKARYIADVVDREETGTTAVGFNYATPHAKSDGVKTPILGFMSFSEPIQWDSDSEPVNNAFQIAVPGDAGEEHLQILATIFRKLIHEEFRQSLANCQTPEQIVEIVSEL